MDIRQRKIFTPRANTLLRVYLPDDDLSARIVRDAFAQMNRPRGKRNTDVFVAPVSRYAREMGELFPHRLEVACRNLACTSIQIIRTFGNPARRTHDFKPVFLYVHCGRQNIVLSINREILQYFQANVNAFDGKGYHLTGFRSKYSKKIYNAIKSSLQRGQTSIVLSIDALHKLLDCVRGMREQFNKLRRHALTRAEKDINGKTDVYFTWEAICSGSHVTAVKFQFYKMAEA